MNRLDLRLAATLSALAAGALPSAALAQAYVNATIARPWEDIAAIPGCTPTTVTFGSTDDDQAAVNFGFTFNFLGTPYTGGNLGTNGYLVFGTASAVDRFNAAIGTAATPNSFIAPWWDDLVHATTAASQCTIGNAPNRVYVVQAGPAIRFQGTGDIRYQIRLYEGTSGRFEWSVNGTVSGSVDASVGYEGPNGAPSYSPVTCSPTCAPVDLAGMVGQVFATFIANAPELTGSFGTGWVRGAFPGQTASGPVIVRNLAIDAATNVTTELYLSANNTYEASDASVGSVVHPNVPGGNQPRTVTATITVPAGTAPGDYFLIGRVDAPNAYPESSESDNVIVSTFRFATAYDLVPTAASSANGGNPGDPIAVSVTIGNAGVPYAGPIEVTVYASQDQIFDAADPRIVTTTVNHAGGATETFTVNGTLPALTPGTYFPIVVLDGAQQVVELNEANNSFTSNSSFPTGPDFAIGTVTIPTQAPPASQFEVATTVRSAAVPFTGMVGYRLYLSTNNTFEPADIALGAFTVNFTGQASIVAREMVTMPMSAAPGAYFVIAVVDSQMAIRELNETNNTGASTGTVLNGYDFRATSVSVNANAEPSQPITVGATVQSVGLPFTGQLPVTVFLSPDNVFDPADIPVFTGTVFVAGLTTATFNQTFNLPSTTPIGTYNAIVVVDPSNTIPETNDMNNSAVSPSTLRLRGADLVVRAVSGPEFGFGGREYPITVTIANEGEASARGMQWAVYYSENDIIRVTDTRIYVSPTTTIAVGASVTFTATVTLPVETATVTRYLGVFADIFSRVPELRETNNVRALPGGIRVLFPVPDLSGDFVETGTAAAAGEQFAITRILRNEGVADAANFDYQYVLSTNPTLSSDDVVLGRFSASIPVGGDDYGIDVVTLPSSLVEGNYYLGLVLDPDRTVDQVSRENDGVVGPQIAVFGAAIRFVTDRLPGGTVGVPYEAGIYASGGAVARSWSVQSGSLPGGLTIDAMSGIISGTPTEEGNFEFVIRASAGTAYADRPFSVRITAPTVPLTIATSLLPPGLPGREYDAQLIAVGGVVPYTWTAISTLPPGLTLEPSGRIRGTPTTPGNFRIVVRVRDDLGAPASREVGLNVINPDNSLLILQQPLRIGEVGVDFCMPDSFAFLASGGTAPYTWRLEGMGVPGLTLMADGTLCGTPEQAGTYPLLVRVEDQTGLFDTSLFIVDVRSGTELAIATGELPRAQLNTAYSASLTAVRGEMPYVWTKIQGELPPGVTMTEQGVISGTPTTAGTYAFAVQLTDAKLRTDVRPLSIIVVDPTAGLGIDEEDSGCGCTTSGRSSGSEGLLAVAGIALLGMMRRRKPTVRLGRLAVLLTLASAALAPIAVEAQTRVTGTPYVMFRRNVTYTPITGGTQVIGPGVNTTSTNEVQLPFPFRFYDRTYNSVRVSVLGAISFVSTTIPFTNVTPGTPGSPEAYIAPFWHDEETDDTVGAVRYVVEGAAPTRVFVIEWVNINDFANTTPRANFQVRLHEGIAGRIQVRYGPVGTGAALDGTMGMEDHAGARPIFFDPVTPPCTTACNNAKLTSLINTEVELTQDPGIELVALSVTAPTFGYLGAPMEVEVGLANLNGSTIGPFTYAIEASRTRDMANAVRIFESGGVTFPPYQVSTLRAQVVPPASLGEGEYYLRVVVDAGNAITEVDESNNRAVSVGRVRILEGKADLVVERVTVSTTDARAGASITVYATITNRGSDPATARAAVMLSSNPAITPQDLALGTFNVTLAPLQSVTTTQTVMLAADTNSGVYYIGVQVDVDGMIEELSESNNGRPAFQPVSISGAGLAISTTRLPAPVIGVPYVALLNAIGGAGTYRWEITQGMLPAGIGLVPNTGELFGRASRAESQTFTVRVTSGSDSATRQLTLSPSSPDAPLTIVTREAPSGSVGVEYAATLVAIGGSDTSTLTWTATGLPAGLSVTPRGDVTGIPTAAGSSTATFSISDGTTTATRDIEIRIRESGSLSIVPEPLMNATLGTEYTAMLQAAGGIPPYTWTIDSGVLPMGVTLDVQSGRISGTPTQVGRFVVVVQVRDAALLPSRDANTFELVVVDSGGLTIKTASIPTAYVGQAYDVTIESEGGTAPYSWRVIEGRFPPGITPEVRPETGAFRVVGTPTEVNVSNVLVEVTDGAGRTAIRAFALDVQATPPVVVTPGNGEEEGGCSCGTSTRADASLMGLVLVGALLVLRRRRR